MLALSRDLSRNHQPVFEDRIEVGHVRSVETHRGARVISILLHKLYKLAVQRTYVRKRWEVDYSLRKEQTSEISARGPIALHTLSL